MLVGGSFLGRILLALLTKPRFDSAHHFQGQVVLGSINVYLSPQAKQGLNGKGTIPQLGWDTLGVPTHWYPNPRELTFFLDVASGLHGTTTAHNPE